MNYKGIQELPPKIAAMFAERARRGEGCVVGEHPSIYEFHQGSNVVCLIHLDPPMGHVLRDPRRADELRAIEKSREASK